MRAIAASAARGRVRVRLGARGRVLRAYQSSRATFRRCAVGGLCPPIFWGRFSPPFWVGFSACFSGVGGCACGGVFGGLFWGGGVGVVGERERQRRTGKGERAQGRTATAKRRKRERAHGLPVFVRPSNIIFLALIISRLWWGVFYSQTATEKRRTVCVRSLSLPQTFLRTPNTSHSVDGFGNLPNSGGEFRNRNHGVFL